MIVVVSFWCYHCCWFLLVSFSVSFRSAPTSTFSNFPSRFPCLCSIAKRGATRRVVVSLGVCITCFCHCLISTQTFQRVLTASVDSCAEMKEYMPFQWCNQLWQSLEESARKRGLEYVVSSEDSLTVSAQPRCAIACSSICAHVKNPEH